ncbi:hypothetical protein Hanom_Chr08g00683141 [Helianthus anomalus]
MNSSVPSSIGPSNTIWLSNNVYNLTNSFDSFFLINSFSAPTHENKRLQCIVLCISLNLCRNVQHIVLNILVPNSYIALYFTEN